MLKQENKMMKWALFHMSAGGLRTVGQIQSGRGRQRGLDRVHAFRPMNQEQFGQFWTQLKAPLKAQWQKITDEDLLEIEGNLATFGSVVEKRYGEAKKDEVTTWVNRRYSHWTGNYVGAGYKDADPKAS